MTGDTPAPGREHVQALIATALDESTDRCARCKVCDSQINAVVRAVWPLLESAGQAEAKLSEVRELCEEAGTRTGGRILAIIGGPDQPA